MIIMKNKKLLVICSAVLVGLILAGTATPHIAEALLFPEIPQTKSTEFAKKLGAGWNLGNTLEACEKGSEEKMGLESEAYWGNPYTTKKTIEAVKNAGFKTVRIPITWAPHLGDAPDYKIDEDWLARVKQIVDWVLECDMYAVINVHHDDAFWLVTDKEIEEKSIEILTKIWAQLAEEFKNYDERLIFDIMNEPRVVGAEEEWYGTDEYREVVNKLHKEAVETIRKSGGNNETRFLMLSTYAAKEHKDNVKALVLPDDEYLLVTIHFYYGTAHQSEFLDCENKLTLKDKKEIYDTFRLLYNNFVSKGIGVVNGEFGWTDRENKGYLREKAIFYVETASKFGIPCFVWDNGESFRLFNRETMYREYGFYIQAIVRASELYE